MKNIAVFGSTGSIGTQTLDVIRMHPELFRLTAIACKTSIGLLEKQAREFNPVCAVVYEKDKAEDLKIRLKDTKVKVLSGMEGLIEMASMTENSSPQEMTAKTQDAPETAGQMQDASETAAQIQDTPETAGQAQDTPEETGQMQGASEETGQAQDTLEEKKQQIGTLKKKLRHGGAGTPALPFPVVRRCLPHHRP